MLLEVNRCVQLKRWSVVCGCVLQRGQRGEGWCVSSTLCRYDIRMGLLLVLNWARVRRVSLGGKLESTHPSRTSVKSDQGFFGVESVMRVNADSLLIRAAATSTSGTLNDLTTDLIMANNNNQEGHPVVKLCFNTLH